MTKFRFYTGGLVFMVVILSMFKIFLVTRDTAYVSSPPRNDPERFSYHEKRNDLAIKSEKRHIAFLKVHKAASSTAQNLFLRFAFKRNLLLVMPRVPKFIYPSIINNWGTVTADNIFPAPKNRVYEILCNHVVYNRKAFERIMPKDTIYIATVRDPFDHFISILHYVRPHEVFKINGPNAVSTFLQNPTKYTKRSFKGFVNNRMAFEFGFPDNLFHGTNETGVQNYLEKLDKEFQLVIVSEMFEESVVLMRRLLNWGVKDILYMKLNSRMMKLYERISVREGDVLLYKRWANLDFALYDYFYQRLQRQIYSQGPDFHEELLYFKRLRRDVEIFCRRKPDNSYYITASFWNDAFEVTADNCRDIHLGEVEFSRKIRLQQYGYYNDTPLSE